MGRKSRDKRRRHAEREANAWYCSGCGAGMHRELAPQANQMAQELSVTRQRPAQPLHVCGICKTLHKDVAGKLVKLTPAEEFELRMQFPQLMDQVDRQRVPTSQDPAATVLFPEEETP